MKDSSSLPSQNILETCHKARTRIEERRRKGTRRSERKPHQKDRLVCPFCVPLRGGRSKEGKRGGGRDEEEEEKEDGEEEGGTLGEEERGRQTLDAP